MLVTSLEKSDEFRLLIIAFYILMSGISVVGLLFSGIIIPDHFVVVGLNYFALAPFFGASLILTSAVIIIIKYRTKTASLGWQTSSALIMLALAYTAWLIIVSAI